MYDMLLKYCPVCDSEFRPEINHCGACEVDLLSGAEMAERESQRQARLQGRSGVLVGGEDMVMIQRGVLADMRNLEALLKEERIAARISADPSSCGVGGGCRPSSFLLEVSRDDAEEAMKIANAEYRRQTKVDLHQKTGSEDAVFSTDAAEVSCPACGYRFRPSSSECPDCGLCFA